LGEQFVGSPDPHATGALASIAADPDAEGVGPLGVAGPALLGAKCFGCHRAAYISETKPYRTYPTEENRPQASGKVCALRAAGSSPSASRTQCQLMVLS
jgi:hypothetical protein